MNKQQLGSWGERMAALYLEVLGYELIKERYRIREGEIDLIMRNSSDMVFVEVKTRTGVEYGLPEEAVTKTKLMRMRRAAQRYLSENKGLNWRNVRFDVVAIQIDSQNDSCEIRHLIGIS